MANTYLTPTAVVRKALMILHNKLTFLSNINRQYDDQFAKSGAKIGNSLKIKLPNRFTSSTGAVLPAYSDVTEDSVTLTVGTQRKVAVRFSSVEQAMHIDSVADQILEPAMTQLATDIEAEVLASVYKDIYQVVGTAGTVPVTLLTFLNARAKLNQQLTPKDNNRHVLINSPTNAGMVDALKGLFHSADKIEAQYEKGLMGMTAGFKWWENDMAPVHTNSAGVVTGITVNGADQTGAAVTINTSTTAYSAGTVVTFAGCYDVHPETRVAYAHLKQFVVGAGSTATSLNISPAIVITGVNQNCSASPTDSGAIVVQGAASTAYPQNLAFHRDFMTFATADLPAVHGADFYAREVHDGISMRIVRMFDIVNDQFPCRIDVFYGYKTLRPQMACRITS